MDVVIQKPTVQLLLETIKGNALALDIAKNHTGICLWQNGVLKTIGFEISEYDNSDYHAEYKMRRKFKDKLIDLIKGIQFEYIVVEDVYGGENFDTVRKLLALQTVIDELIFDSVVTCEHFYRWKQPEWAKRARQIYKMGNKLKSKYETQGLLEYLEFSFYIQNKDLTEPEKEKIFFEDICDACGMLMAVVAEKHFNNDSSHPETLKNSDIVVKYVQDVNEPKGIRDERIKEAINKKTILRVELNTRSIEKSIYNKVLEHPDEIMYADVESKYLGQYGLKKKFTFYTEGGCLIFYRR